MHYSILIKYICPFVIKGFLLYNRLCLIIFHINEKYGPRTLCSVLSESAVFTGASCNRNGYKLIPRFTGLFFLFSTQLSMKFQMLNLKIYNNQHISRSDKPRMLFSCTLML